MIRLCYKSFADKYGMLKVKNSGSARTIQQQTNSQQRIRCWKNQWIGYKCGTFVLS